jgi:teichuronic acid biosynthesis glycosyltransferase TuaC
MKVLYIRSGNNGRDPISTRQGNSLKKIGVDIEFYDLIGRGLFGYLSNIPQLRKFIKSVKPDILHAHYSLSGMVATLTFTGKPIVVSLMGSDVNRSTFIRKLLLKFFALSWKNVIVKSEEMHLRLGYNQAKLIPNGVDESVFKPCNKTEAIEKLGWNPLNINLLFSANPDRIEKNYALAKKAIQILNGKYTIQFLHKVLDEEIWLYYNACDCVILTSTQEGSPNVIKEAMASNCPIVSTDVGDVRWLFGETDGHILCSFDPKDVAEKIETAVKFRSINKFTQGRERLLKLELSSSKIAQKIHAIYLQVLNK